MCCNSVQIRPLLATVTKLEELKGNVSNSAYNMTNSVTRDINNNNGNV